MTRKIFLGMLAACLLLFGWAGAETLPYIQDDADLLTAAEETLLYADMLPLCEYGAPMFWTTNESGNYETLARNFYHSRLGNGESGTLFVINMYARQLTIFSDGAIYRVITDGEAESITDNVYRMAGRGEYYDCAAEVFREIGQLLRGEQIARPMKLVSNALLGLTLALLGIYAYIHHRYENKPAAGKVGAALPVTAAGAAATFAAVTMNRNARMTKQRKTNISSSSGGGGGHGGGFGGGGGGHSSGGGGSHGF